MGRDLSVREQEVVAFLILHGQTLPGEPAPTSEQRQRLLSQLRSAQAGPRCDCGRCPSIEIQNVAGQTPPEGNRITLHATAPAAELTLFIDDDQLSYLELAPNYGQRPAELPLTATACCYRSPALKPMRTGNAGPANTNGASVWCVAGAILLGAAVPALVGEGWWFFATATALAAGVLLIWAVHVPAALLLIVSVVLATQVVLAFLTKHDDLTNSHESDPMEDRRPDV